MAASSTLSGLRAHVLHLGACEDCRLVLADPEEAVCGNDRHTPSWSIECPGLEEGKCRAFWECMDCTADDCARAEQTYFVDGEDDVVLHGVPHEYINGAWMVPSEQCWLQTCDGTVDGVSALQEEHALGVGAHLVFFDEADGTVTLTLLTPGQVFANVLLEGAAAAQGTNV